MIKTLTPKEKIRLLVGKDLWTLHDLNGKIHTVRVTDGPLGVRQPNKDDIEGGDLPSISYPSSQTLSFTWNLDLAKKTGEAIANDCIDRGMSVLLAPGVNIKRLPICGRNFEYYSEDPLIAGLFAREYILGVQGKGVGTSLKHFCGNNIEYSRNFISSDIDERTLREIYLPAFEIACQAKPWTVMCAYNLVNGVKMTEHAWLYGVLRKEFGFDGAIISDWWAVEDRVASLNAGLDLEMPCIEAHANQLFEAYERGELDMEKVDESVERLLKLVERSAICEKTRKVDMTVPEREEVSLSGAEEGIVLLKNEGVLPLKRNEKILVTGAPINHYYSGGGSSQVKLRGEYLNLEKTLSKYCENVTYFQSADYDLGHCTSLGNLVGCLKVAETKDVSIVCVGNNGACEAEGFDRQRIALSKESVDIIKKIAKRSKKTVVAVYAGSAIDMREWIDDVDAVLWAGYGGEFVNLALAKILVGEVNPSGKLTETFPLKLEDVKATSSYRDEERLVYEEGLEVGYRYFSTAKVPALFPFGYGLSYSKFDYSNFEISGEGYDYTLSLDVENLSDVDGKEVVQIYVRQLNPKVFRPEKELKAFAKVFVSAHSKERVSLKLDKRSFAYYSVEEGQWAVDEDIFEIQVCASVEDVRLRKTVEIAKG